MAKPPRAGRVKTRLSRDIGVAAATSFYRQSVHRLLHRLGRDPRWQTVLAANAGAGEGYRCWPPQMHRMPQGEGDLGARLQFVIDNAAPGPLVMIGTDSPQIEPHDIAAAFRSLGQHDAVFGPAADGGYWLIGLARRRPVPPLFEGVRWSTAHTLEDSVRSLPREFRVGQLRTLGDVDTGADLRALRHARGAIRFGPWGE